MCIQRTSHKIPNLIQSLWDFVVKTAPDQSKLVMKSWMPSLLFTSDSRKLEKPRTFLSLGLCV